MLLKGLNKAVYIVEVLTAVVLVIMTALAVVSLFTMLYGVLTTGTALFHSDFTRLIVVILDIFILIELFRIALAYMTHKNVLPTVFEAALVAVARKFVVFEVGSETLEQAVGLAALLLAVAASWWILDRFNALDQVGQVNE